MEAKKAAGYFTPVPQAENASDTTGRALDKY
jgi:hypothetical protein